MQGMTAEPAQKEDGLREGGRRLSPLEEEALAAIDSLDVDPNRFARLCDEVDVPGGRAAIQRVSAMRCRGEV